MTLAGSSGFNFAGVPHHIIPYAILVVFVAVLMAGLLFWKSKRDRRKAIYNGPHAQNFNEGLHQQDASDIQLNQMGPPPGYQPRFDANGNRIG